MYTHSLESPSDDPPLLLEAELPLPLPEPLLPASQVPYW